MNENHRISDSMDCKRQPYVVKESLIWDFEIDEVRHENLRTNATERILARCDFERR